MASFPIVGGTYTARSRNFDAQRCVNLYPETSGDGTSKSVAMLIGTPGLLLWTTVPTAGVRGMLRFSDAQAIVVAGNMAYSISTTGVVTALSGSLDGAMTPVSMASNGTLIMVVTGSTLGYFINPATLVVTQITDPDFVGGNAVYFDDGYFIWDKPDTGQFQITNLYGSDIAALDFATAEGAPDDIVVLAVDHREVWLFGENSTEVWYDSGNELFPFERIQGAFLEIGCMAPNSVAKLDNSLVWLARDDRGFGTVQRATGYAPQRISTHAVEYAIAGYSDITDAQAFTYSQEGHLFYVLTFPTGNATWVYDASSGLWHERAYRATDGTMNRIRPNCMMVFAGKVLVGDWLTGKVWEYDLDTYTDDGDLIPAIRAAPHLSGGLKYIRHHSLQIDMETGVGLSSGQGVDPQAMLRWSDDGGFTWSNEYWRAIGAQGQRRARVRWDRLGVSRDRVYEVTITDPVKRIIIGAEIHTSAGSS